VWKYIRDGTSIAFAAMGAWYLLPVALPHLMSLGSALCSFLGLSPILKAVSSSAEIVQEYSLLINSALWPATYLILKLIDDYMPKGMPADSLRYLVIFLAKAIDAVMQIFFYVSLGKKTWSVVTAATGLLSTGVIGNISSLFGKTEQQDTTSPPPPPPEGSSRQRRSTNNPSPPSRTVVPPFNQPSGQPQQTYSNNTLSDETCAVDPTVVSTIMPTDLYNTKNLQDENLLDAMYGGGKVQDILDITTNFTSPLTNDKVKEFLKLAVKNVPPETKCADISVIRNRLVSVQTEFGSLTASCVMDPMTVSVGETFCTPIRIFADKESIHPEDLYAPDTYSDYIDSAHHSSPRNESHDDDTLDHDPGMAPGLGAKVVTGLTGLGITASVWVVGNFFALVRRMGV
jgi:hypothetical protein